MKICLECPNHKVIRDPDPDDWFNDDDMAVICLKERQTPDPKSRYVSDSQPYRCITKSCRPYNLDKETYIPNWCPLLKVESFSIKVVGDHSILKRPDKIFLGQKAKAEANSYIEELQRMGYENIRTFYDINL
jgi:hypothetical protein